MTQTAILYGPQGCGKTLAAPAIAKRLGIARVIDGWMPGEPLCKGALHVTNVSRDQLAALPGVRKIDFKRMQA